MATAHGPIRTSASQVKMFEDCPMKWFLAYVEKIKTPSTEAQIFGSCFHMVVEYYLRTKGKTEKDWDTLKTLFIKKFVPDDDEYELQKAMSLNCKPSDFNRIMRLLNNGKKKLAHWIEHDDVEIELEISGPVIQDVTYIGYIDMCLINHSTKEIFVFDHKTTSDFKYCETIYTLPKDIQVGMYCHHLVTEKPELQDYKIFVGHIQYLKKTPNNVQSVKAPMPLEQIEKTWEKVKDVAAKMLMTKETYTGSWAEACRGVDRNLQHCNKYRTKTSPGCAYNPICHGGMSPQRLKENFLLEIKAVENMNKPISPLNAAIGKTKETFKARMEDAPKPEVMAQPSMPAAPAAPSLQEAAQAAPTLDLTMYNIDVPTPTMWEKTRGVTKKDHLMRYYDILRSAYRDASKYALNNLGQCLKPSLEEIVENGNRATQKEVGRRCLTIYTACKALLVAYPNLTTSAFKELDELKLLNIWKAEVEAEEDANEPTDPQELDATPMLPQNPGVEAGITPGHPMTQPPVTPPSAPQLGEELEKTEEEEVRVEDPPAPPVQDEAPKFNEHIILVNCYSQQLATVPLSRCYAEAEEKLAAQYELADVRCHQYNEPVKQMLGYLGSVVENCLKFPIITANANDPVDAIILDALERKGFTVIRGSK